jgi:lipopolysaccharide transport system ATP-binding protein
VSDIVVAESVSKRFRIHLNRPLTLKEAVIRRFREGHSNGAGVFWALRDVSVSVEQGRTLGIIGHNGAGKSTLLRLLCGLGRPTLGTIRRTGRVGSLLELGIGFHPERTGRDNLMTGGMLSGLTKQEVKACEDEIIAFAEIEEFIDQPVRIYSSGMYLRLAFATASHFKPEFMVVDDVLAVGDSRFQKKCLDRLKAMHDAGTSFIIVSHGMEDVRRLCDDVIVLEKGRLVMQGDPESAIKCYDDLMRQRTEKRAAQVHPGGNAPCLAVETGARLGTQEASIDSARLCDAEGKTIETVRSGESLTVELEYSITKPIPDMAIVLEICSETNVKCFETSIPSAHRKLGTISEKGKIRCHIPELPLFNGLYHVNFGLHATDGSLVYDYHWQRHMLRVVDAHGTPSNTRGVVRVRPDWSIRSNNGLFKS